LEQIARDSGVPHQERQRAFQEPFTSSSEGSATGRGMC
jgi:hypothetical protein